MTDSSKIKLCYPCGFFRPGDEEDPIAGEYQQIDGVIWPKTARQFWAKLKAVPGETVAGFSGGTLSENGSIRVPCLSESWLVAPRDESVTRADETKGSPGSEWDSQIPFLVLVYLASVRKEPATYDMVVPRDLFKGVDVFRNGLQTALLRVEETFGNDREGFLDVAKRLGGVRVRGGDVAVRFHLFPKFPVDYILWLGDSEFPAGLTLLVDRGAPRHLSADAIGVALNLLSRRMCREASPGSLEE
jgi:hypothetical protein